MKYLFTLLILLSCQITLAGDVKLGPNHKMGVVIHTTKNYSLVLTTKHGSTEKKYIKFEHPDLDATILVVEPMNRCDVSYEQLKFSQRYYHWGEHGYILQEWGVHPLVPIVMTSHQCWPGHSGSGLYDSKGNLVAICIQYKPLKEGQKSGRCLALKLSFLKNFISDTTIKVQKMYKE